MSNKVYLGMKSLDELANWRMYEGFSERGSFHDYEDYMELLNELLSNVGDCVNFARMAHQVAVLKAESDEEIEMLQRIQSTVEDRLSGLFIDIDHRINNLAQVKRYGG